MIRFQFRMTFSPQLFWTNIILAVANAWAVLHTSRSVFVWLAGMHFVLALITDIMLRRT